MSLRATKNSKNRAPSLAYSNNKCFRCPHPWDISLLLFLTLVSSDHSKCIKTSLFLNLVPNSSNAHTTQTINPLLRFNGFSTIDNYTFSSQSPLKIYKIHRCPVSHPLPGPSILQSNLIKINTLASFSL